MSPPVIAALILLAATFVAGAATLHSWVYGYAVGAARLRRCFVIWLAGLVGEGALLWWVGSAMPPMAPASVAVLIGVPLAPATVSLYHDYAPVPAKTFLAQCLAAAAAWGLGMGSVMLLWPRIGAWGLAVPALMAAAALFWHLRRESSTRDSLIALAAVAALIALLVGLLAVLEWLGLPL